MRLVATKAYTYGRQRLRPGDEFEASPRDAKILLAVGSAKEPQPEPEVKPRAKRAYKRRDMRAE